VLFVSGASLFIWCFVFLVYFFFLVCLELIVSTSASDCLERNDLLCVEWVVEVYTLLTHSHLLWRHSRRSIEGRRCARFLNNWVCVCHICTQIVEFANHIVSFVQVRGSVPLFWSQTGIKYKPPPRIDRGFY